ncbi:MAG: ribose-phosphate diphosphokinase, partial [Christensenellaceae bacterium]
MLIESPDIKIFAGSSGTTFAKKMCNYLGAELGASEVIHFSDGNVFIRIKETVRDKDVYVVLPIGLDPNNEFVELLFWMDSFKRASANSVTAIVPYFGYAKGDKKDEPRVSIRARVCADCIELSGADRVITMDLHSPQVQGFFKKPVDHLLSLPMLCEYIKSMDIMEDLVVVSPDAGFAKTARKYADYLNLPVAIGDKTRTGHDENAQILELIGDVQGKNCIIVDDFSISGGTLVDVAHMLKARGAKRIVACLAHLMLREKG